MERWLQGSVSQFNDTSIVTYYYFIVRHAVLLNYPGKITLAGGADYRQKH